MLNCSFSVQRVLRLWRGRRETTAMQIVALQCVFLTKEPMRRQLVMQKIFPLSAYVKVTILFARVVPAVAKRRKSDSAAVGEVHVFCACVAASAALSAEISPALQLLS